MRTFNLFPNLLIILCAWLFSLITFSCSNENKKLETAFKMAGDNEEELLTVINHYEQNPADSLKLKAARFLIGNMPNHFSYDTTYLYQYRPVIDTLYKIRTNQTKKKTRAEINKLLDSLVWAHPLSSIYSTRENDLTFVKSEFLIDNIDQAFEYYNKNQFKDSILFDDFLKYILPYRIKNGYCLEDWRSYFIHNYATNLLKKDFVSMSQLCDTLLANFKEAKLNWHVADQFPYLKLEDYLKSQKTNCAQKCWFNCMLLRSLGIPVTIDMVPVSRVHQEGHEWNAIKLKKGIFPFDAFWDEDTRYLKEYYSGEKPHPAIGPIQFPKIYRNTFEINISDLLKHAINTGEEIPAFFMNPFLKDVTDEYFKTYSIETLIRKKIESVDYVYAFVMGYRQIWVPVCFGKIRKGKVSFNLLGPGNVYLPACYKYGNIIPLSYPILLNKDGGASVLRPDTLRKREIKVSHVGYPRPELEDYNKTFTGATIEASNDKNFQKRKILYKINNSCAPGTHHIPIYTSSKYRFIRFTIPKRKILVNEIKFFSKTNNIEHEIRGELMYSIPEDSLFFQRLVDGNLISRAHITFTNDDNDSPDKIWVGYDFKQPVSLSAFNFYFVFNISIRKEGIYELLYWDFGWKSLEIKKSDSTDPISFKNVPENALLMIKIHDTDAYSRPFTYSDGKQHWW